MRNLYKIIALLAVMFLPLQAHAFGHSYPVKTGEGRPLSVLMHDQIPVVASNYANIIHVGEKLLANEGLPTEARAALTDYLGTAVEMHRRSLGGKVPGTMSYDWNPYHITYHASLRAAFDALTIIKAHQALVPEGGTLYDNMNNTMFGLLAVCANTFDDITTASDVRPDWGSFRNLDLLESTSLLLRLSVVLALLAVGALWLHHRLQTRRPQLKPLMN